MKAGHEGAGYAYYLNARGVDCFVLKYTTSAENTKMMFPKPQLELRRAVRYVRANSEKYGIDPDKISVMGSSAGGHLALSCGAYREALTGEGVDEIDAIDFMPNGQILCYPVTTPDSHFPSYENLLGERAEELCEALNPVSHTDEKTPKTFLWHTATDKLVKVSGVYRLAMELDKHQVTHEVHIFPFGPHGLGITPADDHVAQWGKQLMLWLKDCNLI